MKVKFKETVTVDNVDLGYLKFLVSKKYSECILNKESIIIDIDNGDGEEYYISLDYNDGHISSYISLSDLYFRTDRPLSGILHLLEIDLLFSKK